MARDIEVIDWQLDHAQAELARIQQIVDALIIEKQRVLDDLTARRDAAYARRKGAER